MHPDGTAGNTVEIVENKVSPTDVDTVIFPTIDYDDPNWYFTFGYQDGLANALMFNYDGTSTTTKVYADNQVVDYSASAVDLAIETFQFADDTVVNFLDFPFVMEGTSSSETINGTTGDDYILAYGGDNVVNADDGNDFVHSYDGDDTIHGGDGDDVILSWGGDDVLYGDDGNDYIKDSAGATDKTLYGGDGDDYMIGASSSGHTVVFYGGAGDDYMLDTGSGVAIFYDDSGNDQMYGAGYADDIFHYTSGLDIITAGPGTAGYDVMYIEGGTTINDISVALSGSYDLIITIDDGVDEINMQGIMTAANREMEEVRFDDGFVLTGLRDYSSWLWGTSGNDIIAGNSNDNVLIGKDGNDDIDAGAGADEAHGGAGNDDIHGDDGDDFLHGGEGDDVLYGDDGLDTLLGGDGADTFVFEAASAFNDVDVIKDFSTGDSDVINIADVLDGYYTYGTDDITDFVQITDDGTDSTLAIDQDGTANGTNFVAVATILGVTGLTDEAALDSLIENLLTL
jgi:Ca2+-binding RTX toxin-like protein